MSTSRNAFQEMANLCATLVIQKNQSLALRQKINLFEKRCIDVLTLPPDKAKENLQWLAASLDNFLTEIKLTSECLPFIRHLHRIKENSQECQQLYDDIVLMDEDEYGLNGSEDETQKGQMRKYAFSEAINSITPNLQKKIEATECKESQLHTLCPMPRVHQENHASYLLLDRLIYDITGSSIDMIHIPLPIYAYKNGFNYYRMLKAATVFLVIVESRKRYFFKIPSDKAAREKKYKQLSKFKNILLQHQKENERKENFRCDLFRQCSWLIYEFSQLEKRYNRYNIEPNSSSVAPILALEENPVNLSSSSSFVSSAPAAFPVLESSGENIEEKLEISSSTSSSLLFLKMISAIGIIGGIFLFIGVQTPIAIAVGCASIFTGSLTLFAMCKAKKNDAPFLVERAVPVTSFEI